MENFKFCSESREGENCLKYNFSFHPPLIKNVFIYFFIIITMVSSCSHCHSLPLSLYKIGAWGVPHSVLLQFITPQIIQYVVNVSSLVSFLSTIPAFYAQLLSFLQKIFILPHIMLQKNVYTQKYTLSNASFKSVLIGHLQMLMHLSICLTFFLTLIACTFLPRWLHATVIIHLVPEEQDFWDMNIFCLLKLHHMKKYSFQDPSCYHNLKKIKHFGHRVLNCFVITSRAGPVSVPSHISFKPQL